MSNRAQRISLIAALGLGILSVTGCSYVNPQTTKVPYSASDGVRTDLGGLELRNLIIVSSGVDKPGRVLGAVFNTSNQDATLRITGSGGSQTEVMVKANERYYLTKDANAAILNSVNAIPGAMETVKLSESGGTGSKTNEVKVPVLDGTLQEYRQYVPSPSAVATSSASASK
ncbi:hypothetical protein IV498_13425 [Paenarthrobacter sp. Z7-10]|nr:hypothetical protein [Paenarthrobacter sp. Z7-10]